MRHNGYCWEHMRRRFKHDDEREHLRRAYFKQRKQELLDAGCMYGEAVWFSVWEAKKRYAD